MAKTNKRSAVDITRQEEAKKQKQFNEAKNKQEQELKRIDRKETSLISQAQYKLDTDKSLYDNVQGFIDFNFDKDKFKNKTQINSGKIIYEDRTHRTEVIFEGDFEVIGNYNRNAQTEKVKDVLEEYLVTQYLETQNPTVIINIKQLANEIKKTASDVRKKIPYIIESLQAIRISYTTKGRLKNVYTDFASIRMISSSEYHKDTDILEVNFDNKYAFNLSTHKFFQLPKKYRQISDNSFPYAYPLAKYIFELARQNKTIITFRSIYEQIKSIPRIEKIKEQRGSPTQRIYEPLINCFNELGKQEDFTIEFEEEKSFMEVTTKKGTISTTKNIDFDKMLEAKIIINWKNKPNYDNINKTKKMYQQKIINERAKQIAKATIKKEIGS